LNKKATWEDIEGYAREICIVRADDTDLDWAKHAWEILEKTQLCEYSNSQEFNEIIVRLFCISEIIHIYNYFSMDERYEPYEAYEDWIISTGFQKIKLIVLAGEKYYEDSYVEEYGEISEVVDILIAKQYDMVIECLIKGFDGKNNMLDALDNPSGIENESSFSCNSLPADKAIGLYEWKEHDFTREFS